MRALCASILALGAVASAATTDGDLRMEVIAAYNFVVDSNIETPAGKSPSAAHLGVRIYNDGPTALTNVVVNIGKLTVPATSTGTPGTFESRVNPQGYTGTFALQMPGGATDAVRVIPSIAPGQYVTQYFFVTYPLKDDLGKSVAGAANVTTDDLWLNYDIWASASEGATTRRVDKTTKVTMRNEISAMANKIWPNTNSKVPDKYLDAIQATLGWRPETTTPRIPGAVVMEGIWYDLGNVGAGFDNDGDGLPDRNAWMQPVGDPTKFSPLAARMVKCYGLVIVKLNNGTEQLIPFEDRLYFEKIVANNTGAVGLVYYEFLPLDLSLPCLLSPYQEVASGYDNEKFNADYGASVGSVSGTPPSLSLTKTGPAGAAPNSVVQYVISATNSGTTSLGNPTLSLPPTFEDTIPANLTYVAGSATINNTLPVGTTATVTWSTNGGTTWVAVEPTTAADVTHIRWALSESLAPSTTATVRFQALVASNYSSPTIVNTGIFKLGTVGSLATATATTNVGSFTIGDFVWQDTDSDQVQDGGETGIANVTVRLYRDLNTNGIVDSGDTLVATTVTDSNGAYTFNFLQDQRYIAAVDTTSSGLVTRFGAGLYQNTTPVTKLYATLPSSATDADFGFVAFEPASIGDQVYFDRNGNGSYEPASDLPLANVTVNLYDNVGTLIGTTSTNLSGEYLFANLAPGTYTVTVDTLDTDIPAYISTPVSSYPNFAITAGQNDLTRDFRFTDPGNITKEVNLSQLNTPGQLTFTLRPSYSGNLLTNAFVQDTLPAGTTFASAGQGGSNLPPVTWALGSNTAANNGTKTVTPPGISLVGTTAPAPVASAVASQTLVKPTGTAENDVMIVTLTNRGGTGVTYTVPTGWILINRTNNGIELAVASYYKIAGASEPLDYLFSFTSDRATSRIATYRSVSTSSPINVSSGQANASSVSITAPDITTTSANTALIRVFGAVGNATTTALVSPLTSIGVSGTGGGPNGCILDMGWQPFTGPGATGTSVDTLSAARLNIGQSIALTPTVSSSYDTTTALATNYRLTTSGATVTVTMTATATGNAGTVTPPADLTISGTNSASATKLSGPNPSSATVNNGSAVFTYTYQLTSGSNPGSVTFSGAPTESSIWNSGSSPSVLVTPPLTLTVNVASGTSQSTVTNSAFFYHNTNVLLGQSQPTVTTLDGSIGDYVWADVNGDGLQAGESGIAGVRVYVDSNGNGVFDVGEPSAVTNHLGAYAITGLGAGTYSVRYDLTTVPTGYVATTGTAISVPLTAGQQVVTADFGLRPPGSGSIGDFVWRDTNSNGLPNTGEVGISGVTVTLYRDSGTAGVLDGSDVVLATATTDANGAYLFPNLHAGNYLVVVNPLSSAIPNDEFGSKLIATTSMTQSVTLGVGQTVLTADFGFTAGSVIGDFVFYDVNGNGTQDYTETGIPGVTVQLFLQSDTNTVIATAVTSSSGVNPAGFYQFTGLAPGTYYTRVLTSSLPAGLIQTSDPDFDGVPAHPATNPGDHADSTIVLNFGSNYSGADFGYQPPGAIGDFVWLDLNQNGIADPGEPGLANVEIQITNGVSPQTVFTDFDGYWSAIVADGSWTVTVVSSNFDPAAPLENMLQTYDADGTGTANVTSIVVAGGVVTIPFGLAEGNLGIDFGYKLNGAYGLAGTILIHDTGTVGIADDPDDFYDDGVDMDAGPLDEIELEGVYVYLYTTAGRFLGTTITDADGNYSFSGLPAGNYNVIIGTTDVPFDNATLTTTVANNAAVSSVNSSSGTSVIQTVTISTSVVNDVDFAFVSNIDYDFGDLPLSYAMTTLSQDGARHIIPGGGSTIWLGTTAPDAEPNGIPNAQAIGDDLIGTDDEDGVTPVSIGSWADGVDGGTIDVGVNGSGWLVGWVDWNHDGDFLDPGDFIVSQAVTQGTATIQFDIPAGAILTGSQSWLTRFRLFATQPAYPLFSYTGEANDGEIEDHLFEKSVGGSIGDMVWIDTDSNGSMNGSEVGMGGVLVELRDSGGTLITSQTTSDGTQDVDGDGIIDPVGYYRFLELAAATYNVTIPSPPAGYTPSHDENGIGTANTTSVALTANEQHLTADFGYAPLLADISGQVRYDTDSNGNPADPDAGALAVKIQLWTDPNGDGDPSDGVQVRETYTDASGNYLFADVPTGNYVVIEINPAGTTSTYDVAGSLTDDRIPVVMVGVDVTGRDFLDTQPPVYAISGTVYDDAPANNDTIDAADTALSGVTVKLFLDRDGDGVVSAGDTELISTTTDSNGDYSFTGLVAGNYVVQKTNPAGGSVTNDWDAQGSLTDSEIAVVLTSANVTQRNFLIDGYLGAITGSVTADTDNNGTGDTAIAGVIMSLVDAAGDPALDGASQPITTVTAVDGTYSFENLLPGTYGVQESQPGGYASLSDKDGGDLDEIRPITVAAGATNTANDFVEMSRCPDTWADWKQLHPTEVATGNPDEDAYANFTEFAFAMPYDSGVGSQWLDHTAWIIQESATNTVEGVFVRPKGAYLNVVYKLQYAVAVGDPTVWENTEIVIDTGPSGNATVVDNSDCTETVTIQDLETLTGLSGGTGVVRIKADLDDDGGNDEVDLTTYVETEGWTRTSQGGICQTYNIPYVRESVFTGTVSSVSGQDLTFTGENLSSLLGSGTYYLEVTSGDHEGQRYDVSAANGTDVTLASDSVIYSAAPYNNTAGAPPSTLAGDTVAIRRHWTLGDALDVTAFTASDASTTADQVQIFTDGAWTTYWVNNLGDSDPQTARWVLVGDVGLVDQSSAVLPPGYGLFVTRRGATTSVLSYGEIRTNDFIRPLQSGNNFVGGGYPVDQSPAGTSGREMTRAVGLFGSGDFKYADSIFVWKGDANALTSGYETYFLLYAPTTTITQRWVRQGDITVASKDAVTLMLADRAVFIRAKDNQPTYTIPSPWTP